MFYRPSLDIRVSVDVGCKSHQVAVGLSTGEMLAEFSISHQPDGFRTFFARLEQLEQLYQCPVRVAMEGYNGYARPLDSRPQGQACLSAISFNEHWCSDLPIRPFRSTVDAGGDGWGGRWQVL
jgi:hypothetical protein